MRKSLSKSPHTHTLTISHTPIRLNNKKTLHGHLIQHYARALCCYHVARKTSCEKRIGEGGKLLANFPRKLCLKERFFLILNIEFQHSLAKLSALFLIIPSITKLFFHPRSAVSLTNNNCVKMDNSKLLMPKHAREEQQQPNSSFPAEVNYLKEFSKNFAENCFPPIFAQRAFAGWSDSELNTNKKVVNLIWRCLHHHLMQELRRAKRWKFIFPSK